MKYILILGSAIHLTLGTPCKGDEWGGRGSMRQQFHGC
jgi:hypothetical protein